MAWQNGIMAVATASVGFPASAVRCLGEIFRTGIPREKALGLQKRPQKPGSFYASLMKIHFQGGFRRRVFSLRVHCRKNATAICLSRFQCGTGKTGISSGSARCSFRKEYSGSVRTSIPDLVYGRRQSHWTDIFLRISRSKCTLIHLSQAVRVRQETEGGLRMGTSGLPAP